MELMLYVYSYPVFIGQVMYDVHSDFYTVKTKLTQKDEHSSST